MTMEERARAVVSEVCRLAGNYPNTAAVDAILSFARAAVAEERERCAKVADTAWNDYNGAAYQGEFAVWIARRIRELE